MPSEATEAAKALAASPPFTVTEEAPSAPAVSTVVVDVVVTYSSLSSSFIPKPTAASWIIPPTQVLSFLSFKVVSDVSIVSVEEPFIPE